jgi:DnaJ-class molecular chaperone
MIIWQDDIISEKTYSEQKCGYCSGTGKVDNNECVGCNGKGTVMVADPPAPCTFCTGHGYAMPGIPCRRCKATGWLGSKKE